MPLQFNSSTSFRLKNKARLKSWVFSVIRAEKCVPSEISFNFVSDEELLAINKKYLKHKTLTDIITFDYSKGTTLSGEIYISIDRVRENAKTFKNPVDTELHRVMIHGVLHLAGYTDKGPKNKAEMIRAEDRALRRLIQ